MSHNFQIGDKAALSFNHGYMVFLVGFIEGTEFTTARTEYLSIIPSTQPLSNGQITVHHSILIPSESVQKPGPISIR